MTTARVLRAFTVGLLCAFLLMAVVEYNLGVVNDDGVGIWSLGALFTSPGWIVLADFSRKVVRS